METQSEMLSRKQAAQLLGVCPRTLRNWERAGKGPPVVREGKRFVRYSASWIEEWFARSGP